MAVALERAVGYALGFVREPMSLASTQSDASGNLGIALFHYRNAESPVFAAPTRNGVGFTAIGGAEESYGGLLHTLRQIASVGSFDVVSSLGPGNAVRATGGWLAFTGVDSTTPVSGLVVQPEFDGGGSWAPPSLSPGGSADDLNVSILATVHWDSGFGDASAAAFSPTSGAGRTLRFNKTWDDGAAFPAGPRLAVMTAPGGTTMSWDITGAQPCYVHVAFTVKAAGASAPSAAATIAHLLNN